jgi:hypothetical protein
VLEERRVQAAAQLQAAKVQRAETPVPMRFHLWVLVVAALRRLALMAIQARALAATALHTSATPLVVVVAVDAFQLLTVERVAAETAVREAPEPPTLQAEPRTPAAVAAAVATPEARRLAQAVRVDRALW